MSDLADLKLIPAQLHRCHERYPLQYSSIAQMTFDWLDYGLGRRDLAFVLEMNRRGLQTMCEIYDLCASEDQRREMRRSFRTIMSNRSRRYGRLFPWWGELHAGIRTRLREHREFVRWGLDPPDEPRRGRRAILRRPIQAVSNWRRF
jgi:hypothetical protein